MSHHERKAIRRWLDELNDHITTALGREEVGNKRTPVLNQTQHKFEEQIEFGVHSGRLTKGEAARLTRMLDRLKRLEERKKKNGLKTSEREKLFAAAVELQCQLEHELQD